MKSSARVNNGWLEVDTVNDLLMYFERLNINGELIIFYGMKNNS